MSALLSLRDVTKTYENGGLSVEVLHGISLDIEAGEFVAIIGQSGSGKSTLMNILGCLDNGWTGSYRLDGRAYTLPKHGFTRTSMFELAEHEQARTLFRLVDSEATRAVYPFAFALEIAFALAGPTLAMTATVRNPGATPLPFSFGFHPAFAWPLPGGAAKEAHRVTFAEPEPQPIRRIDPPSGLVLPEPRPTPVAGRELAPDAALFEPDALIWDELHSRALEFGAPGGARLGLALCQKIARLSGGEIAVENRPGIGCTFTLTLPTAPPETARSLAPASFRAGFAPGEDARSPSASRSTIAHA